METGNELYLQYKLEWAKNRLKALDEIEAKLEEMRALAIIVRDNDCSPALTRKLNVKFQALNKEVDELDQRSRIYRLDCQ